MLVHIQLRMPLFLYDTTWEKDTVLEVEEDLAKRLVKLEQADIVTMTPPVDPHQQRTEKAVHDPHQGAEKTTRHK